MEERNLSHYSTEERRWDDHAAQITFSPEVITGEGMPSGTPARSAAIADTNVKKFFDRKREDYSIFLQDIIENDLFPQFAKKAATEHTLFYEGGFEGRDRMQQLHFNLKMSQIFQEFLDKGQMPTTEEWNRLMQVEIMRMATRPTLDILIPKDTYKNIKAKVKVVITKENEATDALIAGKQIVLQALASNPGMVVNPLTRGIFFDVARDDDASRNGGRWCWCPGRRSSRRCPCPPTRIDTAQCTGN
jgi:hypothetical protein